MPSCPRRLQVDLIEASGARRNEFRPTRGEVFQHTGIDDIVDEDTDSRESSRKGDCLRSKQRIEEDEIMPMMKVRFIQQHAFVTLDTEHRDPHVPTP